MTNGLFRGIVDKALAHLERTGDTMLTLGFQGGEPTLVGLDFYQNAVSYLNDTRPRGVTVQYCIQTNGTTLTREWAEFFAKHHFLVGLSIDGTAELHDKHRIDTKGGGTHREVIAAAELLKKAGCEFNLLTVVTKEAARHPQQIYRFYKKLGIPFQQYIPCIAPLGGGETAFALCPEDYGSFLCRLFDLWYADLTAGQAVYNREFENYLGILLGQYPEECSMIGQCAVQYLIESDGSVYPCDFYALDDHLLGTLPIDDFTVLDEKRAALGFIERSIPLPDECMHCPYGVLCRGGCYRNRNENGKNRFCLAYRTFFAYALPRLQTLAARIRRA